MPLYTQVGGEKRVVIPFGRKHRPVSISYGTSPIFIPTQSWASGKIVDMKNTYEYESEILIEGKCTQAQLIGKNKIGIRDFMDTSAAVTERGAKDGYIYQKPKSSYSTSYILTDAHGNDNLISLLEGGKFYRFSTYQSSFTNERLKTSTGREIAKDTQFVLGVNERVTAILCQTTTLEVGKTYGCYIQVEESAKVTDFEPFCGGVASPSAEYPQEITPISGKIQIGAHGRNLIDDKLGPSTDANWTKITLPAGTYCLSLKGRPTVPDSTFYARLRDISGNMVNEPWHLTFRDARTNFSDTTHWYYAFLPKTDRVVFTIDAPYQIMFANNEFDNTKPVMLEHGDRPSKYEPWRGEIITVDLGTNKLYGLVSVHDELWLYRDGTARIRKVVDPSKFDETKPLSDDWVTFPTWVDMPNTQILRSGWPMTEFDNSAGAQMTVSTMTTE